MSDSPQTPVVSVISLTYNHAPYIRECLDGFLMQKTDFSFEVIIHDDASTDGTSDIVREYAGKYPDIIKPIIQTENQYSKHRDFNKILKFCFDRCKGKYIAFCEGDDYWIDPLKLQKQVDFLEKNPEYGMVYSDFNIKNQSTGRINKSIFRTNHKSYPKVYKDAGAFILKKGYVAPPSWLFRRSIHPFDSIKSVDGSFVYFTHFLATSKVYAFDDAMVTYRKLNESASHSNNIKKAVDRAKGLLQTQLCLIDVYGFGPSLKQQCIRDFYKCTLPSLMVTHDTKEIENMRELIVNKSIREKILFLIYEFCPRLLEVTYNLRHRLIKIGLLHKKRT